MQTVSVARSLDVRYCSRCTVSDRIVWSTSAGAGRKTSRRGHCMDRWDAIVSF